MKVRDIKQYREMLVQDLANITVNDPEINLGSDAEQLRGRLYGIERIDTVVRELTSIAENPFEQIFYEFLQNADDVQATSIYIHFNESGILVVNNGSPFLTDGAQNRGQLRSFLRIRDYQKPQNGLVIGKYGIGSRLLYGFLCDSDHQIQAAQRLENAVINDRKGLVLFSWSNQAQLEEFRYDDDNITIDFTENHENNQIPLLTKILYSYYPAYLEEQKNDIQGNQQILFTRQEFLAFRHAFNAFVENTNPIFDIQQGSAIYIPFGNGIFNLISEKYNQSLITRLRTSLCFLRNVTKININRQNISQVVGKKIDLINEENSSISLLIPNNRNDINVNFYQFLPIPDAESALGFVINTNKWGLLQSRQNIQWTDIYNQNLARQISYLVREQLNYLPNDDRELYILFLKNFIQSVTPQNETVKQYFYDEIIETLKQNLPIANGQYQKALSIKIKDTQLNINPSDVGLEFHWLDESFEGNYGDFESKFGLKRCSISDLLSVTNEENIKNWIKKPDTDYQLLLSELKDKRPSFPFIKTSKGNIISKNELINIGNIIPLTSKTKDLKDIFDAQSIEYTDVALLDFEGLLPAIDILERLKKEIEKVKINLNETQKHTIFNTFQVHFIGEEKKLAIFKNRKGVFYTLGGLVKNDNTIATSGILYDFQIDPTEPYFDAYDGYFMEENKAWLFVRAYWGRVNLNANNFTQIIADFHKLIGLDATKTKLDKDYNWILCNNGTFVNKEQVFYAKKWADEITESDYAVLYALITRITDYKVVSFAVLQQLKNVNFADLPTFGISAIQQKIKENTTDFELFFQEVQVLNGIKGTSSFFDNFIILAENENQSYTVKIKENGDIQFYTSDEKVNNFLSEKDKYFLLPKSLFELLKDDSSLKTETDIFLQSLISIFGAEPIFIDLVVKSNQNTTKTNFLSKCEISLKTDANIENYTDEYEGKAIKLMLKEDNWVASYKNKITIDNKALSHYNYKEEVTGGFNLSELLQEYKGISDVLANIKSKLHHSLHKVFETTVFQAQDIENELVRKVVFQNSEQLSFLIYHRNKESKAKNLSGFDLNGLIDTDILSSLYNHKLTCFSQFSHGKEWFSLQNYINTENSLFIEIEKVPSWIKEWASDDEKKKQFLSDSGLLDENSGIFMFRNELENQKGAKEYIDKILETKVWADNTQTWLTTRFTDCMERSGGVYNTIQSFFDKYCEKYAATTNLLQLQVEQDKIKVKIASYNSTGYSVESISTELKEVWKDAILEKINYIFYDTDNAKNISAKIGKEAKIEGEFIETNTIEQWANDKKYKRWCDEIMKNKYQIFFSPTELPFQYTLHLGDQTEVINKDYNNGSRAKVEKDNVKKLYIFEENGKNKRKLLIEYRDDLFSPADDLTKLLELDYEDELKPTNPDNSNNDIVISQSDKEKLNYIEEYTKENILEMAKRFQDNPLGKDGDLKAENWSDKEKDAFERLKEKLKELLGLDNVDEILNDIDKLKEALEKLKKEPKINPISGYIGERLILEWMNFINSGSTTRDDMPDYDLKLKYNAKHYYIEVKTTTGSVHEKDAVSNIFFRPAQQDTAINSKRENYFLVQIGLTDIGLFDFYKQFRTKKLEDIKDTIDIKVKELMNSELVEKIKKNRIRYRLTLPEGLDDPFS